MDRETSRAIANEDENQVRIRKAFSNMPYGSAANFNLSSVMDYKIIADNVEKLKDALKMYGDIHTKEAKELLAIKQELMAVGSLFDRIESLQTD
jgi:hypothetical protein